MPRNFLFVRARVEGVPTIENGREFLLDRGAFEEGEILVPPAALEMKLADEQCIAHMAGHDMPTRCRHCDNLMEYDVAGHGWSWMTGVFYCPKHPREIWIDYFPKRCADTSQDMLNAWPQYADRAKKIRMASPQELLRHQVVANDDEMLSEHEKHLREAPLLFKLTPEGLIPLRTDSKSRVHEWWQKLVSKVLLPGLAS